MDNCYNNENMEEKKYTRDQIKDAIWQELKESNYAGENNDRAYEVIGIVMAGVDKITVSDRQPGLPPLPEPILTDEDVKVWEEEKKYQNCPICGTPGEVIHEHSDRPVEELWESFWKPIVSNEDGTINIEQVKKELADFSFIMEQVPKVYCHITGSKMSKVMYRADTVIAVADDYFQEQLEEAAKVEVGEQPGAGWVKASHPDIKDGEYVAKFKAPGIKLKHDFVGMAFVDDQYIHFVCPSLYDIKWRKGHEELQYLRLLDESGTAAAGRDEITIAVFDFIRDCATNWDHDSDSHKYDTPCRMCDAKKLYELFKQKEKQ